MAYVRWGDDSNLYIFHHVAGPLLCFCCLLEPKDERGSHNHFSAGDGSEEESVRIMLQHLTAHRKAGHSVPVRAKKSLKKHLQFLRRGPDFTEDCMLDDTNSELYHSRKILTKIHYQAFGLLPSCALWDPAKGQWVPWTLHKDLSFCYIPNEEVDLEKAKALEYCQQKGVRNYKMRVFESLRKLSYYMDNLRNKRRKIKQTLREGEDVYYNAAKAAIEDYLKIPTVDGKPRELKDS